MDRRKSDKDDIEYLLNAALFTVSVIVVTLLGLYAIL